MVSWLDDLRVLSVAIQNKQALSVCEDKWYHKFIPHIKIHNMVLPSVGLYFCFPSAERWCISVFAVSVQAFSFSSVTEFLSGHRRLGYLSDQNASWLNHNATCFKLFRKLRPVRSCIHQELTFSIVLEIVSWHWDLLSSCYLGSKFWSLAYACGFALRQTLSWNLT